jgi:hypothetical protein
MDLNGAMRAACETGARTWLIWGELEHHVAETHLVLRLVGLGKGSKYQFVDS